MTPQTNPLPLPLERYRPLVGDWDAFQDSLRRPLPRCLWANPLRVGAEELRARFEREGLSPRAVPWDPLALVLPADFEAGRRVDQLAGLYHIQESVSLLPALVLAPRPGERVLDLCAAPGGKTARMAVEMANSGTIVANDHGFRRVSLIKRTLERLGIFNGVVTDWNASLYPRQAGSFDAVLADVPCSGEGTSRKSIRAFQQQAGWRDKLVRLQEEILVRAVERCRPGGRVVYSTCTYAPEENEAVVDAVLRRLGPSVLRLVSPRLPGLVHSQGLTEWNGRRFLPELERAIRVWPHQNDSGGFFVAALEKIAPSPGEIAPDAGEAWSPPPDGDPEDVRGWTEMLERFGIGDRLAKWQWFRPNGRYIHGIPPGVRVPARPEPVFVGLPVLRLGVNIPKPSTPAALAFGPMITRNRIELAPAQLEAFTDRGRIRIEASQLRGVDRTGFVAVAYDGFVIGTGLYRATTGELESHFPKNWKREITGDYSDLEE